MASDLLKGLSVLYDMEKNDYLMSQAINKLDEEISWRGNYRRNIIAPDTKVAKFRLGLFFKVIVATVVVSIIYWSIDSFLGEDDIFSRIMMLIMVGPIVGIIFGIMFGIIIGLIVCIIVYFFDRSKCKTINDKEQQSYEGELSKDHARVQQELVQRDILIGQRDMMIRKQRDSRNKLSDFYRMMGIDQNYRNLIPIGYMYELCRLGIATKLGGADGLYYLVRQELRSDKLQYSLDEISNKLDTIISNQSNIYYQINDINDRCNNLIAQTRRAAELAARNNQIVEDAIKNTNLANYRLQRIQAETEYQNTMKWISGRW